MDFQFHFLCTRFIHQGSRWDWAFTAGSEIGPVLLDSQPHLNALKQRESGSYIKGFDMWQCDSPRLRGRLAFDMQRSQEHPLTAATFISLLMTRSTRRLENWKGTPPYLTVCLIVNEQPSFSSIISLTGGDRSLLLDTRLRPWISYYYLLSWVLSKMRLPVDKDGGLTGPGVNGGKETFTTLGSGGTPAMNIVCGRCLFSRGRRCDQWVASGCEIESGMLVNMIVQRRFGLGPKLRMKSRKNSRWVDLKFASQCFAMLR